MLHATTNSVFYWLIGVSILVIHSSDIYLNVKACALMLCIGAVGAADISQKLMAHAKPHAAEAKKQTNTLYGM